MERAVVAGGAGLLGSHLIGRMLDEGAEVVCVDNFSTGRPDNLPDHPRLSVVEADVTMPFTIDGPVTGVFNLASPASPTLFGRIPLEILKVGSHGAENCLALAEAKSARILFTSTSEVYGNPLQHPQAETYWGNVNPIGPRSVYDESKRYAEAITTAYRVHRGVDTCIARVFNTYGPGLDQTDGRMVPTFIWQALNGDPITVTGDGMQTRSLSYVADTVDGLLRLFRSGESGPVNIGGTREITVLRLAELIKDVTRSDSPIVFEPRPTDDPDLRRPDIRVAKERLGWSPTTSLADGLEQTVRWFQARMALRQRQVDPV